MKRKRTGRIVEKVVDKKTKREGVVRLEMSTMYFWTEDKDDVFESKDGADVRRWLEARLAKTDKAFKLEWIPVIEAEVESSDRFGYRDKSNGDERAESMRASVERYYLARTAGKVWYQLPWAACDPESAACVPEEDRFAQSKQWRDDSEKGIKLRSHIGDKAKPFTLPHKINSTHYLHYTPELWAGLVEMLATVARAREVYAKLIATKEGVLQLESAGRGQPLLGAGSAP